MFAAAVQQSSHDSGSGRDIQCGEWCAENAKCHVTGAADPSATAAATADTCSGAGNLWHMAGSLHSPTWAAITRE